MSENIAERIQADIKAEPVLLYMKGTPALPNCGFSSFVAQVLQKLGVPFASRNVLDNPELRQGIKDFSNWPTIPQLYVKGDFLGGADIVRDMYVSGELQDLLRNHGLLA